MSFVACYCSFARGARKYFKITGKKKKIMEKVRELPTLCQKWSPEVISLLCSFASYTYYTLFPLFVPHLLYTLFLHSHFLKLFNFLSFLTFSLLSESILPFLFSLIYPLFPLSPCFAHMDGCQMRRRSGSRCNDITNASL